MASWLNPVKGTLSDIEREMAGIFAISDRQVFDGTIRFSGRLLVEPVRALTLLTDRLAPHGYYPLIRSEEEIGVFRVLRPQRQSGSGRWVNVLLFLATLVTTVFVGATNRGADPLTNPWALVLGLPFAVTLLSILGVHELGHYFTARRYGITVTLPYFIPAPIGLGTFGAFIKMKSPVTNRKALFDVGIAGPLAGLCVALPAIVMGLSWSDLVPENSTGHGGIALGTPLAFWLARSESRFAGIVSALCRLPIVIPPAVAGIALLRAFGRRGLFGAGLHALGVDISFTEAAVVMAQMFVAAPFFVEAGTAAFGAIDPRLIAVARTLGASPARLFFRVALPLARRGLVAGAAMAWARALGEFGATLMFAGNLTGRTQTLPLAIYTALESDLRAAQALSVVLVLVAFGLLALLRGRDLLPHRRGRS